MLDNKIDGGKITKSDLELMEKRAKEIKLPADMGRIPYKISIGKGFSGFTADQWKSFILIYATPLIGCNAGKSLSSRNLVWNSSHIGW